MSHPSTIESSIRTVLRTLCLAIALAAGLAAAPAAAGCDPCDEAHAASELAVDRSARGYVFPREGVAAQPAVTTRKKFAPVKNVQGDDPSGLPAARLAGDAPRVSPFRVAVGVDFVPAAFVPHAWRSRAPPFAR